MLPRAKIQDVARLAGVALSTVSAVLNGKNIVSGPTRERVLQAIETLQYRPDHYASNLARRQTNVFGVIVSNLLNPFFSETAQAIEDEARRHGFGVTLMATNFSPELLREAVRQMLGARIAGIAVMTSEYDEEAFEMVHRSGVASVFLDVGKPEPRSTNIRVDTRGGMVEAVRHLVDLGHRDLLLVRNAHQGGGTPLLSHVYRTRGFAAALRLVQGARIQSMVLDSYGFPTDAGREAIQSAVGKSGFTAVVCTTDLLALGVYRGLHEAGISVPSDMSVIGFDNTFLSAFMIPALTTVDIPRLELSRLVVSALLPREEGPRKFRTVRLATRLIVRSSTAPPTRRSAVRGRGKAMSRVADAS
ncbi:MAG: substrate-binding domain-containing protein [Acidobacteriaceae bacterium]